VRLITQIRIIHGNVIGAMKTLCQHVDQFGGGALAAKEEKQFMDSLSGNEVRRQSMRCQTDALCDC
jgi:hypothetical protein